MIAIAQDAQGASRVAGAIAGMEPSFPILVDEQSQVAAALGFRLVPAGAFVGADGAVAYASDDDFDVGDPRLRSRLESFVNDGVVDALDEQPMNRDAMDRFAAGVEAYADGHVVLAESLWRQALELDPDNFLIRSQIWAARQPERFWPVVDRAWQEQQLMKEGYDGPLP